MTYSVASFYKFVNLANYAQMQVPLLTKCREQKIKGTILLAEEGINATIVGLSQNIATFIDFLRQYPGLAELTVKECETNSEPFKKMKVKLKKEIVTIGVSDIDPNEQVGTYINAQEWNKLIKDPEVILVDTRNDYEVDIGTFKKARNPHITSFRQFPNYVKQNLDPSQHSKVALFCTGGIRCEKATSLMLKQGFKEVYHLKDGILRYLEEIPCEESLWEGECFVFDERVAVKQGLVEGSYQLCSHCGSPVLKPRQNENINCPYCSSKIV